jgi:hypothetical protein
MLESQLGCGININYQLHYVYLLYGLYSTLLITSELLFFYNILLLNVISVLSALSLLTFWFTYDYNHKLVNNYYNLKIYKILLIIALLNWLVVSFKFYSNQDELHNKAFIENCLLTNDTIINCNTISKKCYELYNMLKVHNITFNIPEFKCDF